MSVLRRPDLEASPLADLHELASTLGIDGFRRLRRDALIDRILARQTGDSQAAAVEPEAELEADVAADDDEEGARAPRRRRTRARAGTAPGRAAGATRAKPAAPAPADAVADEPDGAGSDRSPREQDRVVEGAVELLPNGSGFVRLTAGETADDDVYISAAQVRRCELVDGDRVRGPVRPARRSERHPSLIRVEQINGAPAEEVAAGTRFEDLDVAHPSERLPLDDDDETLAAIARLAPFGRGSRVAVAGPSRSGKTELLRRIAAALADREGVALEVALVGVRPEEHGEWQDSPLTTTPPLSFAATPEAQAHAVEQAVERGRRIAARGGDAVLLIDTLDGVHPPAARRALASARNLREHGSLTIIATMSRPLGGETTVIALDLARAATGQLPALDPLQTGTVRPDLLVGAEGAAAITRARAEALGA